LIRSFLAAVGRHTLPVPDASPQPVGSGAHPFGETAPEHWEITPSWPASSAAWSTPRGVADRLLSLIMQSAWNPTLNTCELSGHAHGHIQHLRRNRGMNSSGHALLVDAVQMIASSRFAGWPDAQRWQEQALRRLPISLVAGMHPDGSPMDSPSQLYTRLWCTALAQATMLQQKQTLPTQALDALAKGTRFMVDFAGPSGKLPMLGEEQPTLGHSEPNPSVFTLAHLAHQWMDLSCPRPDSPDRALRRIGGSVPTAQPWPASRFWTAHAWRSAGLTVAHNATHHLTGRASDQSIWWTMNGQLLIHGSATNAIQEATALRTARTDDRTIQMQFGGRSIKFEGQRLTVIDTPSPHRQRWTFPVGTHFTKVEKGYKATTPISDLMVTTADHWEVDEHTLVLPTLGISTDVRFEAR
jgi:hypothetical protein